MNSKYYNNGVLNITLDDYLNVFNIIKRELDLNEEDDRYDLAIESSISDELFRLARQELHPNQHLVSHFPIETDITDNTTFTLDLTCISRVLWVRILHDSGSITCVPRIQLDCLKKNSSGWSYKITGNQLVITNIDKINSDRPETIELVTNGGNIYYWLTSGWRILVQAVKANMYLNYFKSLDEYNACMNSYALLYKDLERQTYTLYEDRIKANGIHL